MLLTVHTNTQNIKLLCQLPIQLIIFVHRWHSKKVDNPYLNMEKSIQYTPVKIGVEVRGIDLSADVPENVIDTIRKDVRKHRLLIFKDQGVISGPRHVEISQWFGELESTFYKHPRSPHPDVFRVSNNPDEGCTNVGRTGWHIDGSFMSEPFDFALYHMVSVPKEGSTGELYFG